MLRSPAWRARRERTGGGPDLVGRTRRLFHLCAVATLLLTVPASLPGATPESLVVLAVATTALVISWTCRYRFRRASLVLDGADAVALGLFALTCSQPAVAFAVTFTAQWSRALYGRAWHAASYVAGLSAGMVGAVLLWEDVPWHAGPTPAAPVVVALSVLVVSAVVSRHLAAGLLTLEESQRRDAALADLGTKLLGLTDRDEIFRRTWAAADAVCRASAGLVVATFDDDGAHLHLRGQVGGTRSLPATVARPATLGEGASLPAAAELTAVAPEWRG